MLSLKNATSFQWSKNSYDALFHYLSFNKFKNGTQSSIKSSTLRKSKYFFLDNNKLKIHLLTPFDSQPLLFQLAPPDNVQTIIQSFLNSELTQALNYRQLYHKIINARWLGISRRDVLQFLKEKPLPLQEVRVANDKPFIQSFRPMYPFEYWQIDLIDFRKLREQNRFPNDNSRMYSWILVVIDIFSKFIYLFPIEGNVESLDQHMMQEICNHLQKLFLSGDVPKKIGSDNQFDTKYYHFLCNKFHINPIFGLPHHPQTQGFVENKIKHIKSFIYLHFNTYKTLRYFDTLDQISFAINTCKHSVTNKTPLEIHRGRLIQTPSTDSIIPKLPQSFDLQFPTFSDYTKPQSKSKNVSFNLDDSDPNVVDYDTHYQQIYKQNVDSIRSRLHLEAQKREQKQRSLSIKFSPGSFVKVRTFIELSKTAIQPIQLRLQEKNKQDHFLPIKNPLFRSSLADPVAPLKRKKVFIDDIKEYQKSQFSKSILKSTFDWVLPLNLPGIFRITSINISQSSNKSYQLSSTDGLYILQFMTHNKQNLWSSDFRLYMLHHTTYDINTSIKYRPHYNFIQTPIGNSDLDHLKQTHNQTIKNLKSNLKQSHLKSSALLIDHFDRRSVFGLTDTEVLSLLQTPIRILEDSLIYYSFTSTNLLSDLSVLKLKKVSPVKGSRSQFKVTNAKYQFMNPHLRHYESSDTANTFILHFQSFLVSSTKDLQPDSPGEWVFVYPNKIRDLLKLPLVYP